MFDKTVVVLTNQEMHKLYISTKVHENISIPLRSTKPALNTYHHENEALTYDSVSEHHGITDPRRCLVEYLYENLCLGAWDFLACIYSSAL